MLIANPQSPHKDLLNLVKSRITGYITATKYVMLSYNVEKALLGEATKVTPGINSPTITDLANSSFCSVSALVLKKSSYVIMDQLQKIGASDILVFDLANSRM